MKVNIDGKYIHLSQKVDGVKIALNYYGFTLAEAMQDFLAKILKIKS